MPDDILVVAAMAATTGHTKSDMDIRLSDPEPHALELGPARASAWLHRAADPEAPALLIVPALGTPAGAYRRLAEALAAHGLNALRVELRGNGESPVRARRGIDWGYLDLVDDELRALYALARAELPDAPPVLLGHSLGGHLALLHQARHPDQPTIGVALVASGSPWHRQFGALSPLLRAFGVLTRAMAERLGAFRGDWLGFGGAQGASLMREWAHFLATGRLPPLGAEGWDPHPALARLQRPVFAISMRRDHYAPPAATEHLASLTAGPLELRRLESVGGGRPPGHFLWLRHPEPVARLLAERFAAG
ncbi:alpha/beta fold hydrolase [Rehaibacterium terrae]|uniref:Putative alpha/beta hydrolase n=1 Tax=Rehaibacterium terrae TaxID=1341696 RepID=A0A7W7V7H8_9GAMM|nr:putative alpha/beta hydrolase [Rehaibacterium terrae]